MRVSPTGEGILESVRPSDARLCVDVGQTGARVLDSDGVRHSIGSGLSPGQSLADTVLNILNTLKNPKASTVLLSLTGLKGFVPDMSELAAKIVEITGCEKVCVADDGLAWSVGALAGADGVSLAVGGGVVSVARRGETYIHLDGNGADFGDSGGAYWLGREGIRAAIRGIEETDDYTSLQESFAVQFGAYEDFVRRDMPKDAVYSACVAFAKPVLNAATNADPVASGIIRRGAGRLARVVLAAGAQAGLKPNPLLISLGGGVMAADVYRGALAQQLNELNPGCLIIEPQGDAIDGLRALHDAGPAPDHDLTKWWMVGAEST